MNSKRDLLYVRLASLWNMMGDGLHLEEGGWWIKTEHRKICIALGIIEKPKKDSSKTDEFMAKRLAAECCGYCGGKLKQVRKGSFVAICACGEKWKLGGKKRGT